MASGSSRSLRSHSARMTPYSVKSRSTSGKPDNVSSCVHIYKTSRAVINTSQSDSANSSWTTEQLAMISKGIISECTNRVFCTLSVYSKVLVKVQVIWNYILLCMALNSDGWY